MESRLLPGFGAPPLTVRPTLDADGGGHQAAGASMPAHRFIVLSSSRPQLFK
jgi:hypothetical protein